MKQSFSTLNEITEALQREPYVIYRLFIRKIDNELILYAAFFDVFEPSGKIKAFNYDYDEIVFVGGRSRGAAIAKWFSNKKGVGQNVSFRIPELQEHVNSLVSQSGSLSSFLGVEEPHSISHIQVRHEREVDKNLRLVAPNCPTFLSLVDGVYYFLYDRIIKNSSPVFPDKIEIRWRYDDVWIKDTTFQNQKLTISIDGKNVRGSRLEVRSGLTMLFDEKMKTGGNKRVSISQPLTDEILILLSRDNKLLDYHYFDTRFESTPTLQNEISELLDDVSKGENETLEFKREIPPDSTNYLKTIVAFANGIGGRILFGVNDDTTIEGLSEKGERIKTSIRDTICDRIEPRPKFDFKSYAVKGASVIALLVEKGELRPYGIKNGERLDVYIRRGSSTRFAKQQEIRELSREDLVKDTLPNFPLK